MEACTPPTTTTTKRRDRHYVKVGGSDLVDCCPRLDRVEVVRGRKRPSLAVLYLENFDELEVPCSSRELLSYSAFVGRVALTGYAAYSRRVETAGRNRAAVWARIVGAAIARGREFAEGVKALEEAV